jgi:hypothetical protein
VSAAGRAAVNFRMPRYYLHCTESFPRHCRKIGWKRHERVVVNVFGYLQQATTLTSVAF